MGLCGFSPFFHLAVGGRSGPFGPLPAEGRGCPQVKAKVEKREFHFQEKAPRADIVEGERKKLSLVVLCRLPI